MKLKNHEDFELERFIEMFDTALTSKDERVINALRSLLMIVTLTAPESNGASDLNPGPLMRLFDNMHQLSRRVSELELRFRQEQEAEYIKNRLATSSSSYNISQSEFDRISKLINSPSQLAKKEI